ncbi:unnamed protein product, partial [Polarella glacialis]
HALGFAVLPVQAASPCAPPWLRIPAEAWALAADQVSDRDVGFSAAAARCLLKVIGSQDLAPAAVVFFFLVFLRDLSCIFFFLQHVILTFSAKTLRAHADA